MSDLDELFKAAVSGDTSTIRNLIEDGVDPNTIAAGIGHSALYNATYADQVESVRVLLRLGADPNLKMDYRSPVDGRVENGIDALMYARSDEVANLLIEAGANVNSTDGDGVTPLIRAVHRGKPAIVKLLLAAGADPDIETTIDSTAADVATAMIRRCESESNRFNRHLCEERAERYVQILNLLGHDPEQRHNGSA